MTETLAAALAAFQAELPAVGKDNTADAGTYKYRYADLAAVSTAALPLLGKHGLSFTAWPTLDDGGRFVLEYTLLHEGGEQRTGRYPLPSGSPQQVGSAITYARRYTLLAVTGVAPADDDDDGKGAADTRIQAEPPRWDAAEQDALLSAWTDEIGKAKSSDEIAAIGKSLMSAKRSGDMSPNTYQKLAILGGRRKAELDKEAASEPA